MHQNPALTGLKRHAGTPVSMFFPILSAHISGAEFQYPDLILKEPCGKMANRMSESGVSQYDLEVVPGQPS
jgi:hypothetical protein